MIFIKTEIEGAYIIEPEKLEDERGFFARVWDNKVFEKEGLDSEILQSSISFNKKKGTVRGMHYQMKPYEESKMVKCVRGKIYDIIVDLREDSKTFKKSYSVELSAVNHKILYIPKGVANGFQTLEDNSEIHYDMFELYSPDHSLGFRWDDPVFTIKWPLEISTISQKDKEHKPFIK